MTNTIAFMTANYVARQLGYQMTEGWGQGDKRTQAYFKPLKTFATRFEEYLRDIRALGFDALDLWTAILHPDWATEDHIEAAVDALKTHDLTVTSYAGGFGATDEEFEQVCELAADLGIGVLAGTGSVLQKDRSSVVGILRKYDLVWGWENHPEKTPEALLKVLGKGDEDVLGVAVDTGWFGTQGYDAAQALDRLNGRIFYVHLKDVRAAGAHETCQFGEGVVPIQACVETLKRSGYTGGICIEHEPETYDPTDEIRASFELLKGWLA